MFDSSQIAENAANGMRKGNCPVLSLTPDELSTASAPTQTNHKRPGMSLQTCT